VSPPFLRLLFGRERCCVELGGLSFGITALQCYDLTDPQTETLCDDDHRSIRLLEVMKQLAILEWNWSVAEDEFKGCLQLNPSYATAHLWYAAYLAPMGQWDESIAEHKRAGTRPSLACG
jgi:Tfp pilus assembly protein PilF